MPESGERLAQVIAAPECAKSNVYWSWNGGAKTVTEASSRLNKKKEAVVFNEATRIQRQRKKTLKNVAANEISIAA